MSYLADRILISRLLLLQSKRLLLATAEINQRLDATDQAEITVQRRQSEVREAQGVYNDAVLRWGEPLSPQYRLVAYGSLVAKAERLRAAIRSAAPTFPHPYRGEAMADVENLGTIIASWNAVLRDAMAEVA